MDANLEAAVPREDLQADPTPRLFAVELRTVAIVQALDEYNAYAVARAEQREICGDVELDIDLLGEVNSESDVVSYGWDSRCLPYGGDGETRLSELLSKPAARSAA